MNIVCIDIETTGTDKSKDNIIQISMVKFDSETYEIIDTFSEYVCPNGKFNIGIGAYLKHHIEASSLTQKRTLFDMKDDILSFLKGCEILSYNGVSFDLPFLSMEFARNGVAFDPTAYVQYDAFKVEESRNSLKLKDVYHKYTGKVQEDEHNSLSDAMATIEIFKAQNEVDLVKPVDMLTCDNALYYMDYSDTVKHILAFSTGKYKDVPVVLVYQVDPGYIDWVLRAEFCKKTKQLVSEVIQLKRAA